MLFPVVLISLALWLEVASGSFNKENIKVFHREGRIVGGTATDITKHPHHVSIRYKKCDSCPYLHQCAGSILNSNMILTSAHGLVGIEPKNLHVVAGTNTRNGRGVVVPVVKNIIHENYNKSMAYDNDVAILVLGSDLPLNSYDMKPIRLTEMRPADGSASTIAGWGSTWEKGEFSEVLLEANIEIFSDEECKKRFGNDRINESMICAGTTSGERDTCHGDSGGTLMVNGSQAGIVSWGELCGSPIHPTVYSNVSFLRPWIDKVISVESKVKN